MQINTKFNIGDKVLVMIDNKPTELLIDSIEIFIHDIGYSIWYVDEKTEGYADYQVFPTKKELLKSL